MSVLLGTMMHLMILKHSIKKGANDVVVVASGKPKKLKTEDFL